MAVRLYLDVFFAVNFLMDTVLLYLVKRLMRLRAKTVRLGAGAAVGAIWACAAIFLPPLPMWAEWCISWLGVGLLMVRAAFGAMERKTYVRCLLALWVVSVAAGGVFAVAGDGTREALYLTGSRAAGQFSLSAFGFCAAGVFFAGRFIVGAFRERLRLQNVLYDVTLHYGGRKKTVRALWDTGNRLYEPYTHQPVHVLTKDACKDFCDRVSGVIYIPFRSVGADAGVLPGIRMERMEVCRDGKFLYAFEKPWVAISRKPLSGENRYQMLLNGEQMVTAQQ